MAEEAFMVAPEVQLALDEYFRRVDHSLPGTIEGFYLVGSIALGDYVPRVSDLDFVAVSSGILSESETQTLTKIHRRLARTRGLLKFDGLYTTWKTLGRSTKNLKVHRWLDRTMHVESDDGANPVTWATLKKYPFVIRGGSNLEIFHDEPELRTWCTSNLAGYWTRWVELAQKPGPRFLASFTLPEICWGVLGVIRLHATIATGEIISKTEAANYGRRVFTGEWHNLLRLALAGRHLAADRPSFGLLERRAMALRFMRHVIADAGSMPGSAIAAEP